VPDADNRGCKSPVIFYIELLDVKHLIKRLTKEKISCIIEISKGKG
jgi:hypothetical protein